MPKFKIQKINSLVDLDKFARQLSGRLKGGDIVALSGELGSGKTTLVQTTARALGARDEVMSPSFVIFKIYQIKSRPSIKKLCHIDLYRLRDFSRPHGFEEHIGRPDTICFIEWPEKIAGKLPPETIWLAINTGKNNQRIIKITPPNASGGAD